MANARAGDEPSPGAVPSLGGRAVRGAGWVLGGRVLGQGLQVVMLVALARLLTPGDFGVFGIAMLATVTLDTFSHLGFRRALIQHSEDPRRYLDTAWCAQVIRGLVLAGLMLLVAPLVGWFFREPRAVGPLRLLSLRLVLGGFVNVGIVYFHREIRFHRQFIYDVVGGAVALVVGVAVAWRLHTVYALVWAKVAQWASNCILSYALHPYRPAFRFYRKRAAELFRFGRWMLGSQIVLFLVSNLDDVLVGRLLGSGSLGLYRLSYTLSNLPPGELGRMSSRVAMPVYGKLRAHTERLGRAFLDVLEVVVCLALPLAVFVGAAAPEIVDGLLGRGWRGAVVPLQVLAGLGFLRAMCGCAWGLFVGTGRPQVRFRANLARLAVIVIGLYPLTKWYGLRGTCLAMLLGAAATLPAWALVRSTADVRWSDIAERILPAVTLGALVLPGVWLGLRVPGLGPTARLCVQVGATGCLCAGGAYLYTRFTGRGLWQQARVAWTALRSGESGGKKAAR